jgi:hypothetical protein
MIAAGESSSSQVIPPAMSSPDSSAVLSPLLRPNPALDRFCKWIYSVYGTDQLIMLIQYTLDIITHHMNVHTLSRIFSIMGKFLPFLGTPYPAAVATTTPSPLSTRLKTLSEKLADVRILLRLHGIFPTYQWLLSTHASPPSDPTLAKVAKLQTYANMLYFPLENAAYLGSHAILPMKKRTEIDLWIWSCRFWAAHVALDLFRLYRERQIRLKGKEKEKPEDVTETRRWWASLIMNLAYAPLTIHWSLENGLLRDVEIGYFGVIAAIASIYLGYPSS